MDLVQPVSRLMRRNWIAVAPRTSLDEAERVMRLARVRQVPVEANGRLRGLLDHRDVIAALLERRTGTGEAAPRPPLVSAVMDRNPPTVGPTDRLGDAVLRMAAAGVGCLPVVGATGRLVGLVVESDLLRWIYG